MKTAHSIKTWQQAPLFGRKDLESKSHSKSLFNYLMELRLENNPEMNAALRKEAVEEIKGISRQFQKVQMLVIEDSRKIIGSSLKLIINHLDYLLRIGYHTAVLKNGLLTMNPIR